MRLGGGGGELGHGLGALRHGVLGELSGQEQADRGLDLSGGESGLLAVARQTRRLKSKALEYVVDEGVKDGHASLADTSVGVDLLENLVDVGRVRLNALVASLASCLLGSLGGFLSNSRCLGHFV